MSKIIPGWRAAGPGRRDPTLGRLRFDDAASQEASVVAVVPVHVIDVVGPVPVPAIAIPPATRALVAIPIMDDVACVAAAALRLTPSATNRVLLHFKGPFADSRLSGQSGLGAPFSN